MSTSTTPTDATQDTRATAPSTPGGRRTSARIMRTAHDVLSVRRAFGEPVTRGEVTIVPVARVVGGSGTGWGTGETSGENAAAHGAGSGSGGGGGLGVRVTPVGVYVVDADGVRWEPAFDLTRVAVLGELVGALALVVLARALRRRRR